MVETAPVHPATTEPGPERRRRPTTTGGRFRSRSLTVLLVTLLVGVTALYAPAAPTAIPVVDVLLRAGFALAVTGLAATARRGAWATATGAMVLAATAAPVGLAVALVAFAVAVATSVLDRRSRVVGVLLGATVTELALWLPPTGPLLRTPLLVAIAAGALVVSGARNVPRATRQRLAVTGIALGAFCVLATAGFAITALLARPDVDAGAAAARSALDAARAGDTAEARRRFAEARTLLVAAQDRLARPWAQAARLVPGVGQHEEATQRLLRTAIALSEAGEFAARNADIDALRAIDGRLDPAAVTALAGPLRTVDTALRSARRDLADSTSPWLLGPLRAELDAVRADLAEATRSSRTARLAVETAPTLLGAERTVRYFVMFTTPAEARASGGGFMGNWGILTAKDGRLTLERFERTGDLTATGPSPRTLSGPPEYLARYTRFSPTREWVNVNLDPDLPTVAEVIAEMGPQSGTGPLDGVIAVNPAGLAALLRLTGPVTVPGLPTPLTADNATQVLLRDQYLQFPELAARVDFLAGAAQAVTEQFTRSSLPAPRDVGRALGPAVRDGDLAFVAFDPDSAELLDRLGTTGRIPRRTGDSLGVVTQNAAGNKLELFLERSIDLRTTLDPSTGRQTSTATIRLRNTAPRSGLPGYVIGNQLGLPAGTSRLYLSIYTPLVAKAVTLDGTATDVTAEREHGRNVYSRYVTIPPGGEAVLEVELAGPLAVKGREGSRNGGDQARYRLTVWRPAMVNPDALTVNLNTTPGWNLTAPALGLRVAEDHAHHTGALRRERKMYVTVGSR